MDVFRKWAHCCCATTLLIVCLFVLLTDGMWKISTVFDYANSCLCVCLTQPSPTCVLVLFVPSFTVVWGHSRLMAANSTSVKASKCGQLKSRSATKRRMTAAGPEESAFIQWLALSFLMQCLQVKAEFKRPLQLKGCYWAHWKHTHTHKYTCVYAKIRTHSHFQIFLLQFVKA